VVLLRQRGCAPGLAGTLNDQKLGTLPNDERDLGRCFAYAGQVRRVRITADRGAGRQVGRRVRGRGCSRIGLLINFGPGNVEIEVSTVDSQNSDTKEHVPCK